MTSPSDKRKYEEMLANLDDRYTCSPPIFRFITLITAVGMILPKKEGSPNDGTYYKRYIQYASDAYRIIHPSFGLLKRGYSLLIFSTRPKLPDPVEKK